MHLLERTHIWEGDAGHVSRYWVGMVMGSLHTKQKISYVTSGRNSTDLDLLDEGSEY